MEEQIAKCDLVAVKKTSDHTVSGFDISADCHFAIDHHSGEFYFGKRLWGATTTKSPELLKLVRVKLTNLMTQDAV